MSQAVLPDRVYQILKWIGLIALPALATFWGVIATAWGLPHTEPVVLTLTGAGTLIGALLGLSSRAWNASREKPADP